MADRFHYLTPMVLPILPRAAGTTLVGLNLDQVVPEVAADATEDANLTIEVRLFCAGELISQETLEVQIVAGKPTPCHFRRHFELDTLGYTEISITADRPYFRYIITEASFALVERPDQGTFNVHASMKFSDPVISGMMRDVGEFCLVHPAQYVSKAEDIGNSVLLINPFDGPVVARLATGDDKELRRRIMPREVALVSLADLLNDGEWTCVRYTGSNRYPAWDVRHSYSDPFRINRLDHLEYYRASLTLQRLSIFDFAKARARQVLRTLRLRAN